MRLLPLLAALALATAGCVQGPLAPVTVTPGASHGPSGSPNAPDPSSPSGREPGHPDQRFPGCSGEGPVRFSRSPMRAEDFEYLLPYGLLAGAHVTPIDHMYFAVAPGSARDAYEVRAIADAIIAELQPRVISVDSNTAKQREWRIDFAHTCTFTSYFDLLTSIDPLLEKAWKDGRARGMAVKAGQLIGRIGAQTLDFAVYDYNVTLAGFLVPSHYERERWKVHTVDPFPHFADDVRELLLSKMLRKAEPRAGRIDWDIAATLSGNWFQEGTNGYAGAAGRWDYWDGHLAFVYDALDPSQLRFSIGNWSSKPMSFGVVGNAPHWSSVGPASAPLKIELGYASCMAEGRGVGWVGADRIRAGDTVVCPTSAQVQGVALIQMLEPSRVKVQVFPGQRAVDVLGFSDAARIYER